MTFGNKLHELRAGKELTQKELGMMLGKTSATISDWEKGKAKPSIDELSQLADIFQVTTDYILGRITPYAPFQRFIADYTMHRDRIINVTMVKKFNQDSMGLLDRLLVYIAAKSDSNSLVKEMFQSVGYRIDLVPDNIKEWEEPLVELPEQKMLRLEKEKKEKLIKRQKK